MPKLKCNDYGFECNFEVDGEQEKVIENFRTQLMKFMELIIQKKQ